MFKLTILRCNIVDDIQHFDRADELLDAVRDRVEAGLDEDDELQISGDGEE